MSGSDKRFQDYLSRHYAHLGPQDRHRERRMRQLRTQYAHVLRLDRESRILEIGPGFGQWLEVLREQMGFRQAQAIDLSEEVVRHCESRMPGSTLHVEDATAWLLQCPGTFQRIFMFHVLEHVPTSQAPALLRAIRAALTPDGMLVLEVPNAANLLTGSYLRYADLTHTAGFTESSLRQLLTECDFHEVTFFEDRLVPEGPAEWIRIFLRGVLRMWQQFVLMTYQVPVPKVLSPMLCATARPRGAAEAR